MGTEKRERQKAGRQARLEQARLAEQRALRRRRVTTFGVLAGVALATVVLLTVLGSPEDEGDGATSDARPAGEEAGPTECPPESGSPEPVLSFSGPPPMCIDPNATYVATFDTSEGEITVLLDTVATPMTVNNFVTLARYRYYDGTELFRTDPSIGIIQGGAPTNASTDPGPGYTIADEGSGFTYRPGQLVMARTSEPDSAGAQFFFVAAPEASNLDATGTYVVFGEVIEGMDVLEAIFALNQGFNGPPSRTVTVEAVTVTEYPPGITPPLGTSSTELSEQPIPVE